MSDTKPRTWTQAQKKSDSFCATNYPNDNEGIKENLAQCEEDLKRALQEISKCEESKKLLINEKKIMEQKLSNKDDELTMTKKQFNQMRLDLDKSKKNEQDFHTEILKLRQEIAKHEQERDSKVQVQKSASTEIQNLQDTIQDLEKNLKSTGFKQTLVDQSNPINYSDFYDGIIDIPNMKELINGWDITIKNWKEYQELAKKPSTIVSVIGNYGKGKTFLLELLTGNNLLHGFNVNTQGISVVYLKDEENQQRPIMALDTKGGGNPLNINSNVPTAKDDVAKAQLNSESLTEKLRDHSATEDLLQNFILEIASIIIVVVADLTFDDQRLVNKIMSKYKADPSKKIIVVHNLYHTYYINDATTKIRDSILPSFVLDTVEFKAKLPNSNNKYFVDTSRGKVPHLVLAKQNSEAGDYYNAATIKYILDSLNSNDHNESVDIIQTFHKYLQKNIGNYIQIDKELKDENLTVIKGDEDKPVLIRLENISNIQMKAVIADVFGDLQIFKDGFCPNYTLSKDTEEKGSYLCLKIECPDFCDQVKSKIEHFGDEYFIQVKGLKGQTCTKDQVIMSNRQCGEFFIKTPNLKKSQFGIYYDQPPVKSYENGMYILKWKLNENPDSDWM